MYYIIRQAVLVRCRKQSSAEEIEFGTAVRRGQERDFLHRRWNVNSHFGLSQNLHGAEAK